MRIQPTQYFDDEDERRRWELEHMARFSGGSLGPDMEISLEEAERDNPYTQAPPEPDEERAFKTLHEDEIGRGPRPAELEMDAMRAVRDSYGKEGNFWEENAVPLIAGGLDVALNKGRGLGAIVAGGGVAAAARDSQRRSAMRQLAQMQLTMAGADAKHAHEERMFGLQEGNLQARNAEIDEARQRRLAGEKDDAGLRAAQADLASSQAYKNWTTDPNALTPQQQALNEDRDLARGLHADEIKQRGLDREETRAGRAQLAQSRAEDRQTARDQAATVKFLDKTEEPRAQASQLKRVEPIVDDPKYSKDLPGVGMLDSRMPSWLMHPLDSGARQDADAIQKLAGEAGQYFKHEITGAASSDREQALLLHLKGLEPGATEEQFRASIKFWKEDLQGKLRARASAAPGPARGALEAQGLGDWALGPEEPIRLQGTRNGAPSGGNNFSYSGPPDSYLQGTPSQLRTTGEPRGQVPMVNDYLRRMQDEDDDLGVRYR